MKKSLIAVAALAAVSAASAQSSVTLYGLVDIGYASSKIETRDGLTSLRSRGLAEGSNAGNRIGFRGTEDLGGGLKANFVIEQAFSPTSNDIFQRSGGSAQAIPFATIDPAAAGVPVGYKTSFGTRLAPTNTNRQTYVGLSSATLGTFNIGYQYNIVYEISTLSGYNIGAEGVPGADRAHQFGQTYVGGTRANNITYISPNFGGGFTVRAQYGTANELRNNVSLASLPSITNPAPLNVESRSTRYGLMGQYINGPISAALGYTRLKGGAATATGASPVVTEGVARLTQLAGSYDFGVVKLAGSYNDGRNVAGGKLRAYQVGLSAPFGAIVPFVTFGRTKDDSIGTNGLKIEDSKQAQIGVRYNLSKRTLAYAIYGQTKDDAGNAASLASGKETRTVVGVQHSF